MVLVVISSAFAIAASVATLWTVWQGAHPNCERYDPCRNGAICHSMRGEPKYRCECSPGYTGRHCEQASPYCEWNEPCHNGGRCHSMRGEPKYRCECSPGYTGRHCEQVLPTCKLNNPCQNGGICTEDQGSLQCHCPVGYTGKMCQQAYIWMVIIGLAKMIIALPLLLTLRCLWKFFHPASPTGTNDEEQQEESWMPNFPPWTEETLSGLKADIAAMRPPAKDVGKFRILLVGLSGAGKSSFINTISSVYAGYHRVSAIAASLRGGVTQSFREYTIECGNPGPRVLFCDTKGLEVTSENPDSDMRLLRSYIRGTTYYDEERQMTTKEYPTLQDQAHVVVLCVESTTCREGMMGQEYQRLLQAITRTVIQLEVPLVVMLTKPDEFGEQALADTSRIFHSSGINTAVDYAASVTGIQRACILPLRNHCSSHDLDTSTSILALYAWRLILRTAHARLSSEA